MPVRNLGSDLASELHRSHLKSLGFRKERSTFARERADHVEVFDIQGSQWNSGGEPWRFYLNVGVHFPDVPLDVDSRGIWRGVHALGRIEAIVPGAPESFEVDSSSVQGVARKLADLIVAASERLPALLERPRSRAQKGLASPLPVPDTWNDGDAT